MEGHQVKVLCQVFGVVRSTYYRYIERRDKPKAGSKTLEDEVAAEFVLHKRRYGSRRLVVSLANKGIRICRHTVRKILGKHGLLAIQPRSFVPKTTQTDPLRKRNANLLLDPSLVIDGPNQVWVGDITYLPVGGQWAYMATWIDTHTRQVKGHAVASHMRALMVEEAFQKAVEQHKPAQGLIVHTDGGSQYSSKSFRLMLQSHGFKQSMTRPDNCYDNAMAESFNGRMKAELLTDRRLDGQHDAQLAIFEYVHYYNNHRLHSALQYKTPVDYEATSPGHFSLSKSPALGGGLSEKKNVLVS